MAFSDGFCAAALSPAGFGASVFSASCAWATITPASTAIASFCPQLADLIFHLRHSRTVTIAHADLLQFELIFFRLQAGFLQLVQQRAIADVQSLGRALAVP